MGSKSTKPKESAESKASPSWDMAAPATREASVPSLAPADPLAMQGLPGAGNSAAVGLLPPPPADPGRRSLPVGRVTQLDLDPGSVLAAFDVEFDATLAKTMAAGKNWPDAPPGFGGSPLEAELRPAVYGPVFQESNHFVTPWVDDGSCDLLNLGLFDTNVQAELHAFVENAKPLHEGSTTFASGAGTAAGVAATAGSTATAGGGYGGATLGLGANESTTRSLGSTGTMGLSSVLPSVSEQGDLILEADLRFDTNGTDVSSSFEIHAGTVVVTKIAGS